jgi:hypothetical protein
VSQVCTIGLALFVTAPAGAFTIQSLATRGCHEEVTIESWRRTQAALPERALVIEPKSEDSALIRDVPFDVPEDLQELGLVTLLLGVRQNDIADLASTSLSDLAQVNSDPRAQRQHCLRSPDQNEPNGTKDALAACQDYIRDELSAAVAALGKDGLPDASKREEIEVTLAIRGRVKVKVPAFQLHVAHGIHALQDSFTHTYRDPETALKIRVILNFAEYAENKLDEAVDGPPHLADLDRCDDPDDLRAQRHELAIEASAAALSTLLDSPSPEAKLQSIDALIAKYTSLDTSVKCTFDNNWCDAPEHDYSASACGCRAAGADPGGAAGPSWWMAGALALLVGGARVRRKRSRRLGVTVFAAFVGLSFGLSPRSVRAAVAAPVDALQGKSEAATPGKKDKAGAFFARVALGASYDKPGMSGGLGVRYQLSESFMLGFDAEWNPWLAITPSKVRAGAANAYVSLIRRWQLRFEAVNIRTTVSAGGSYLLFDLVGAPKGSFGPFLGVSFLGVEWKMARGFYLTVDPTYIAIPIPHVTGVPFAYTQYRFLVGLEFGG